MLQRRLGCLSRQGDIQELGGRGPGSPMSVWTLLNSCPHQVIPLGPHCAPTSGQTEGRSQATSLPGYGAVHPAVLVASQLLEDEE